MDFPSKEHESKDRFHSLHQEQNQILKHLWLDLQKQGKMVLLRQEFKAIVDKQVDLQLRSKRVMRQ